MNAEVFAEWLKRQSHRVVETASGYWSDSGPRVYQSFPYHQLIEPSDEELINLLSQRQLVGLRYSTPLSATEGLLSYHIELSDKDYAIDKLPKKARHDVNRGCEYARIERISMRDLAEKGWLLRFDTLTRQGRVGAEEEEWWRRLCLSADGLPGFEAWAAIHDGQLTAALLAFTSDNCCSILYQQSLSAQLKYGVNNALAYTFTVEAMGRPEIASMFYGLHSLDAPSSVDEFKLRMGYEAKPVRQRVVLHPWVAPAFNRVTHRWIKRVRDGLPNNPTLSKVEGLVRFYVDGKVPLTLQTRPVVLNSDK